MKPLLCLSLLLAGPRSAGVPITYYQDWFPGAQFAGLYEALDRGFYGAAGLDVTVHAFAFGQDAAGMMDADPSRAAVGTVEGYILLQKRAKGGDLRALSAVLRESPAGYMTLPGRGVDSARGFVGKRVGVHRYGDPLFRLFLRRAGVDEASVTMVFVDDDVGRLVRGEVDAMQGYAIEELVRLGRRVGSGEGFLSFRELGFDAYSQVVFSTGAQVREHPGALRAFVGATREGWAYAIANPDRAVDAVMARMGAGADRALVRDMFLATVRFVAPGGEAPLGPMDPVKWRGMAAACVEMGILPRAEDPGVFLSGEVTSGPR